MATSSRRDDPGTAPHDGDILGRLITVLERVEMRLARLERAERPRRLLSMRDAAARIGVSRTRTLPLLVKDRRIRTVVVNGHPRIPMEEVERVEREGTASFCNAKRGSPRPLRQAPRARDLV